MPDQQTWVKDGTEEAEPVTTETPAGEAVETTPAVVEGVTATADETAGAGEAVVAAAGEAEVVAEVVEKFIEGKLGDEVFQLPEGVQVPLKRGDTTEYVPIEEVLKGTHVKSEVEQLHTEIQRERSAFGRERAEHTKELAKLEERQKYVEEREQQVKAAFSDPESAAKYEQHLQMMHDNPMYRQAFERDWSNRETAFERDQLLQDRDQQLVTDASQKALSWIETLSAEFPGVDPGRVASTYGNSLSSGQAVLDISAVRSIYESEAAYLASAREPLETRLDELSARIASITDAKAAEQQNQTTRHAVARAKTVPVATGAGAPAKALTTPGKFGPNELAERNSAWAKAG